VVSFVWDEPTTSLSAFFYVPHGWPIIFLFISSTEPYVLRSTKHEALGYAVFDNLLSRPLSCLVKRRPKPHYINT